MRVRSVAAAVCLCGAWLAAAPAQDAPETEAARAPIEATVADLAWMVGAWAGDGLGGRVEEVVQPPHSGAMPAMFRAMRDGRVRFYEFILFENEGGGVVVRLHHFSPGLKRWEDEPVTFDLVETSENGALFAERGDTIERTRLRYERRGDTLSAELIETRDGEDRVTAAFRYTLGETLEAE